MFFCFHYVSFLTVLNYSGMHFPAGQLSQWYKISVMICLTSVESGDLYLIDSYINFYFRIIFFSHYVSFLNGLNYSGMHFPGGQLSKWCKIRVMICLTSVESGDRYLTVIYINFYFRSFFCSHYVSFLTGLNYSGMHFPGGQLLQWHKISVMICLTSVESGDLYLTDSYINFYFRIFFCSHYVSFLTGLNYSGMHFPGGQLSQWYKISVIICLTSVESGDWY